MIPIFKTKRLWTVSGAILLAGSVSTGWAITDPPEYDQTMAPSNAIGFDIEGCNLKATDATYNPPISWLCDDSAYTDGNLGKNWNELDLVPYRFESNTAGLGTPSETYQIIVGADNLVAGDRLNPDNPSDPLKIGFDEITNFAFNADLSTGTAAQCQLTSIGAPQIGAFGIGGAEEQIVQVLQITQAANTRCVWDYVERLAITSSRISGSSTRSFIFAGTGAQSVPIPSDIQPQQLSKSMSAVEDSTVSWEISKVANPTDVDFGNTCDPTVPNTKDIGIDITLTKTGVSADNLTATTTVTAINPSSRAVSYDCIDEVFSGETSLGSEPLSFTVPAGETATPTLTHFLEPGTRDLHDKLTCTLQVEDILNPGSMLDVGTMSAEFVLPNDQIAAGDVINQTVAVHDTESITEGADRYDFSTTYPTGASGAFAGYTVGDFTDGPVVWNSDDQSDSATIHFTKTVQVERGYDVNGKLEDTASINLTDSTTLSRSAFTNFTTDPKVTLTINKTLEYPADQPYNFTFEICKDNGAGDCDGDVIETKQILFAAGESTDSVDVTGLEPGVTYRITEVSIPEPWVATPNSKTAVVNLPNCSGEVDFLNEVQEAGARAVKVTEPGNFTPKDWTFSLYRVVNGTPEALPADSGSSDDGIVEFGVLAAGTYQIVETPRENWDPTRCGFNINSNDPVDCVSPTICEFNVSYPANAGDLFTCTFTNTQRGKIIVNKEVESIGHPDAEFEFGLTGGPDNLNMPFTLQDKDTPDSFDSGYIKPGSYTAQELIPADWNWDLISVECDDDDGTNPRENPASIELDPGEIVTCTFINRERSTVDVSKTVNAGPLQPGEQFFFDIRQDANLNSTGTVVASATVDASNSVNVPFGCVAGDPPCRNDLLGQALLVSGDYQLCETGLMPGWTTSLALAPGYFVPGGNSPDADNSVYCIPFTLGAGDAVSFDVDNTPPPGGDARTIGFWKNWTSCDGHGNQDPVLDDTLALANQCVDDGSGILIGNVCVDVCEEAVSILDKRAISLNLDGQKLAGDACYNAASQMTAAKLNDLAGAGCPALTSLISATQAALIDAGFDGTGACFNKKGKKGSTAQLLIDYAGRLDDYNNNRAGAVCN